MNPNLKDDGRVYPDDGAEKKVGGEHLPSSSLVEDGGASWRLKTETSIVEEERRGSLGQFAASGASHMAAASCAHLHAVKNRKKGFGEEEDAMGDGQSGRNIGKVLATH
ncbi:hypothetical protein OIU79_021231 [Salix purpurea]|uniref:Uncharacterized protein n=1 Tax=Salix purpurea TaxID=77065 RepID=A0A9Q0WPM4_SALPP|nr:hypothetical protein OIU79_021231 [Salix purpurea]